MTLWNVERLGSFSAVARETGWSQPAISQQIRKIERELDAKLVQRTSHGVELTPIGRILARHGQLIDNRVAQAVKDVEEYQRNGSTHIRLVAPPSVCSSFVARVLVHISKTSDIRVSLMQMEPPEAMDALEQGLADCAIIFQYNSLPALVGPDDLE
ncbi:MAG: LysR family transcriptional regulator, partial [Bifidobacterium pseudocatenulatum]